MSQKISTEFSIGKIQFNGKSYNGFRGTSNNDLIYGSNNNDYMEGLLGNDTLYGGGGDDVIFGNNGDDLISGNRGNDTIYGGNGNDIINGRESPDPFNTRSTYDRLYGDQGNDRIILGRGDIAEGGTGSDTFVFRLDIDGGYNTIGIMDFERGVDRIIVNTDSDRSDISFNLEFHRLHITDNNTNDTLVIGFHFLIIPSDIEIV